MIIVDRALEARQAAGDPIRVGMIGAGFMGRGVANQIINSTPGMELAVVMNRDVAKARRAYAEAGVAETTDVETVAGLESAITRGVPAVTDDMAVVCGAGPIDAIVDVTGAIEFGAHVALEAMANGKHIITMNAELDATAGPILKVRADKAGVILTACDGDQPGVQMNLYRFVKSLGVEPMLCGNVKGLQDPYRTPTTQKGFAEKWGQDPHMVTSFADGTKISFEQAIVANATGMSVVKRGMSGFDFDGHIDDATELWDVDELREIGGAVDYLVGSRPGPGVFVYGTHDDPRQQHYLNLYKLGEGPLYSFYTPYHLCHFEVPTSVARAVLFDDPVMQPAGAPRVEVVALAKTDLRAGATIDGLGGYDTYGECERAAVAAAEAFLPMGTAEGCTLLRDVGKDEVLRLSDVELPDGRLVDELRDEQAAYFS